MYKPAALHHSVSTVSYTPCTSLCMPADQRVEIGCRFKGKAVFPHTSDVTVQRTFLLNFTRETVFVLIKFEINMMSHVCSVSMQAAVWDSVSCVLLLQSCQDQKC